VGELGISHRYNQRREGCFDHDEDQSLSPSRPGPQAFGRHILRAPVPQQTWAPTNITKYLGQSNPSLWVGDYRLACQAGGVDHDNFVI
jgi:hypothetical protein